MNTKLIKPIFYAGLALMGLVSGIFFMCRAGAYCHSLPEQRAAERWGEDSVQMSCFLSESAGLMPEEITYIREAFDLHNDESLGWYDAYSCEAKKIQAFGTKRVSKTVLLTLISENYFRIHSDCLLEGNYLTEADRSCMHVVVNEQAAWELFGSFKIAGMQIAFENRICEVVGVVEEKSAEPRIYMLYEDYMSNEDAAFSITVYEAVLPEPVEGYGEELFISTMDNVLDPPDSGVDFSEGSNKRQYHIVRNTDRLSLSGAREYLKNISDYITQTKVVAYPDYENQALALLHKVSVLFMLSIIGFLLWAAALLRLLILFRFKCRDTICNIAKCIYKCIKKQKQEVIHHENNEKEKKDKQNDSFTDISDADIGIGMRLR